MTVEALLAREREGVEATLHELFPAAGEWPDRLWRAMAHAVFAGGKRVRPVLARLAHRAAGGDPAEISHSACGLELIHTYSLVHDDLPALDDDVLRRGRPTVHVAFDEATAILAGDALLTLAFEMLSTDIENSETAVRMIRTLSEAAGPSGMIAGQVADMNSPHANGSMQRLQYIHMNKTAEMFAASTALGALAGGATDEQLSAMIEYGMKIGLGFQIADDLLDITASSEQLGKTAGKDAEQGKLTYPALVGEEKSREIFEKLTCEAVCALQIFGKEAETLRQLAMELLNRTK